jgi:hypothetical protein
MVSKKSKLNIPFPMNVSKRFDLFEIGEKSLQCRYFLTDYQRKEFELAGSIDVIGVK